MSRKSQSKSLLGGKSIVHRDESVAGPEHDYLAFYEGTHPGLSHA